MSYRKLPRPLHACRDAFVCLLLAVSPMLAATAAVDEADLLPVDEAYVLSAKATSADNIRLDWQIADGYYLYRHRSKVVAGNAGSTLGALVLPDGTPHVDEFFGRVETYRQHLTGNVPVLAASGDSVSLKVSYQGCADAGICYPPQTRTLTVKLPATSAAGAKPASGTTTADRGFAALGQSLGATAPAPLATNPAGGTAKTAPLPEEQAFRFEAIADGGNALLLRFTPAPGYYLYRDKTRLHLQADGISAGEPRWPKARSYRDEHFGDVAVYFQQIDVPLPLLRETADARQVTLTANFQGCQDNGICYPPMQRSVRIDLPAGTVASAAMLEQALDTNADTRETQTSGTMQAGAGVSSASASDAGAANAGTSSAGTTGADVTASTAEVPRTRPPASVLNNAGTQSPGLWLALLLALGGGLILNLMPCVLPVLSLKALSLASANGAHARRSALWYTAGVLTSFVAIGALALALRAAGQALGWGFQLQQPLVVGVLVYLMFSVGLNLSGVFSVGYGLAGTGDALARRAGPARDFFTGVLAVVVASPCTAPFMGAALAFAFAASPLVALLVFAALGLGLALPFLLIGFVPALANRLPRPGAWMDTLKNVLAFPMYLTAAWLLWVLGKQRGVDAVGLVLVGIVLLALGLWWFDRLRLRDAPLQRVLSLVVMAASLLPLVMVHRLPVATAQTVTSTDANRVAYSAARLASLRDQGRVVFVDMTADWCVTCKANEKAVLSQAAFAEAMRSANAVLMTGDWTNVDPAITAFLESHKAVGVPLYVVYPSDAGDGEVLPTVLTDAIVVEALARASASATR